MGADFYVLPPKPDEATWRVDPRDFVRALKARWPDSRIHEVTKLTDSAALQFELKLTGTVNGEFQRAGQVMVIDYVQHDEDLGDVVIWFRGLVPASEGLVLVSGPGHYIEITPAMTPAEFVRKLSDKS